MAASIKPFKGKNAVILLLADLQFGKSIFRDYLDDDAIPIPPPTYLEIQMEVAAASKSLIDDINRYEKHGIPRPNIIVIAGDIIFGKYHPQAEALYRAAGNFMQKLLDVLFIKKENVIIVPGNHDAYRRDGVASFENYKKFCKDNEFTYVESYEKISFDIYKLCFHAYNTATINRAGMINADVLKIGKKTGLKNIAIWHHNPSQGKFAFSEWTEDHKNSLRANFDLLLHGHTHKFDSNTETNNQAHRCCSIGSGAFGAHHDDRTGFTGKKGPAVNSYTIIEVDKNMQFMRLYSRMYEPVLETWIPHNTYGDAESGCEDRITLDLNNYNTIDIATPILLVGDEMIRSSISAACTEADKIEFYGNLKGNTLSDIGITSDYNDKIHFHSGKFNVTAFSDASKCKYIHVKSENWFIEFYRGTHSAVPDKSFIIVNGNVPHFAYLFSKIVLSELFAFDAIELNHEKQIAQLDDVAKFRDHVGMKLVAEWSDGYYSPPFPKAIKIDNPEGWQKSILTSYASYGKALFRRNELSSILITWDFSYDTRNSLINVESIKDFIEELNLESKKDSAKITRIFFVNDSDFSEDIELTAEGIRRLIPQQFVKKGKCKFIILIAAILGGKILNGFGGTSYFVSQNAISEIADLKNNMKDIAYYLDMNGEIITIQDSNLMDTVLRKDGRHDNGNGKTEILKVYFRKERQEDKEVLIHYKNLLDRDSFNYLYIDHDYEETVFDSFLALCKKKATTNDLEALNNFYEVQNI